MQARERVEKNTVWNKFDSPYPDLVKFVAGIPRRCEKGK